MNIYTGLLIAVLIFGAVQVYHWVARKREHRENENLADYNERLLEELALKDNCLRLNERVIRGLEKLIVSERKKLERLEGVIARLKAEREEDHNLLRGKEADIARLLEKIEVKYREGQMYVGQLNELRERCEQYQDDLDSFGGYPLNEMYIVELPNGEYTYGRITGLEIDPVSGRVIPKYESLLNPPEKVTEEELVREAMEMSAKGRVPGIFNLTEPVEFDLPKGRGHLKLVK